MRGPDVGALYVYTVQRGRANYWLSIVGEQGDDWHSRQIDVILASDDQVYYSLSIVTMMVERNGFISSISQVSQQCSAIV